MDPLDVRSRFRHRADGCRHYQSVTGQPPKAIGAVLPYSYTANDTCHLWKAGIPCLLYGPGVIRGNADEDDSCVLISDAVKVTKVLPSRLWTCVIGNVFDFMLSQAVQCRQRCV